MQQDKGVRKRTARTNHRARALPVLSSPLLSSPLLSSSPLLYSAGSSTATQHTTRRSARRPQQHSSGAPAKGKADRQAGRQAGRPRGKRQAKTGENMKIKHQSRTKLSTASRLALLGLTALKLTFDDSALCSAIPPSSISCWYGCCCCWA